MVTCVSGYWNVTNKHGTKYTDWFKTTLKINCPYVFFSDKETIEIIKNYRQGLPTFYIEYTLDDFITNQYKDNMIVHPLHCPSVDLNLIWNEKIFLLKKALEINHFSSDFFCWIDAGICNYRHHDPPNSFPNMNMLHLLPKNKFIYSSSNPYHENCVRKDTYYHHISGTSYILHKNIIHGFSNIYKTYLDKLVDKNNIWTDQVVLTHIFKDHKNLFYELCSGYGEIVPSLS